jgi:hypothetical protein
MMKIDMMYSSRLMKSYRSSEKFQNKIILMLNEKIGISLKKKIE